VANKGHLGNPLERGAREPEELLLARHRGSSPNLRVLVDPGREKPDQALPHTLLVHEGDLGARGQAEAEHALGRAPQAREVVCVEVDLVALDNVIVLLLEDVERVLERKVGGQLLPDALVLLDDLVEGDNVAVVEEAGDLVLQHVLGELGED